MLPMPSAALSNGGAEVCGRAPEQWLVCPSAEFPACQRITPQTAAVSRAVTVDWLNIAQRSDELKRRY